MKRTSIIALTAILVAATTPASAATDCGVGFKKFMNGMSTYVNKSTGDDLADAIRRSLVAFDSCQAGDAITPNGVWDQIEADMKAKAGQ